MAPHFDDDLPWHDAFDPLPSFVNKEYALIDAAHIMAVRELAEEKRHVCHAEKPLVSTPRGQVAGKHFCAAFSINLYNDYNGRLN